MDYICYKSWASRKCLEIKATSSCCFTANVLSVYMSSKVYFHQHTLGDQFQWIEDVALNYLIYLYLFKCNSSILQVYSQGHRKQVVKRWQCHAKLASFPDTRITVWAPGNKTNANAKHGLWLCMIDIRLAWKTVKFRFLQVIPSVAIRSTTTNTFQSVWILV